MQVWPDPSGNRDLLGRLARKDLQAFREGGLCLATAHGDINIFTHTTASSKCSVFALSLCFLSHRCIPSIFFSLYPGFKL